MHLNRPFQIICKWKFTSNITKVSGPLSSTVRPFAFIMSYNGGAHITLMENLYV